MAMPRNTDNPKDVKNNIFSLVMKEMPNESRAS
jgi:hypothetical protein